MSEKFIRLNYLNENGVDPKFKVFPSETKRKWMDDTGYAYRCIPLNVANQYGWNVECPVDFTAEWDGGNGVDAINVELSEDIGIEVAVSNFGFGILTITPDFLVETSENVSTYVRGIPNSVSNGITPLDGIIETDWLPFTFTFNYKFTRAGKVKFKSGQKVFNFFPIERMFLEGFKTEVGLIKDSELYEEYLNYKSVRLKEYFDNDQKLKGYYSKGESPNKKHDIKNHTKTIDLGEFKL
jgi:hypothetical protein